MRTLVLLCAGVLGGVIACTGSTDGTSETADALSRHKTDAGAADAAAADAGPGVSNDLRIIVEPSDDGAALVSAIGAATKSVHVTMYELSASDVINALLARHAAGVEVKVVLNATFPGSGSNPNSYAYSRLQAAGISVVWSSSTYTYTHEKCIVLDGETAWIMTMNAARSSQTANREYLAVDTDAADVAEAEAQFAADFAHAAYTPSGPLLMSPVTMRPGLTSLIESATQSIDFEVEEFDDSGLATALCAAVSRKVTVRGVLSTTTPSYTGQRILTQLKGCGVTMRQLQSPYLHAKAIVVDGERAYVGSANFSPTSLDQNRELGLVTTNATAVSTIDTTLVADIGNGTAL